MEAQVPSSPNMEWEREGGRHRGEEKGKGGLWRWLRVSIGGGFQGALDDALGDAIAQQRRTIISVLLVCLLLNISI